MARRSNDEYAGTRTGLKVGGIVLLIVGIAVMIYGLIPFFSAFDNPGPGLNSSIPLGMFIAFGGGVLVIVGLQMLSMGSMRGVTRYVAHEVSPAVETVAGAATSGVRRAGGIPLSVGSPEKEVVKVKCRSCGALNDEADDYCGKCGKRL